MYDGGIVCLLYRYKVLDNCLRPDSVPSSAGHLLRSETPQKQTHGMHLRKYSECPALVELIAKNLDGYDLKPTRTRETQGKQALTEG